MKRFAPGYVLLGAVALSVPGIAWGEPAKSGEKTPVQMPVGNLSTSDWLKYSTQPLSAGEIDRLVNAQLERLKITPAAVTTDEQFLRRVYLDLTGQLPRPAEVSEFLLDKAPLKRARLIDRLLESEEYAKHWAGYWRSVMASRNGGDFRVIPLIPLFERWMAEQLQANRRWDEITKDLLTARGPIQRTEPTKNGQAFFLVSHKGADAVTEIAADTSRIFLGIQIQCAQCHDHPSDVWKRHQFHEFAAYFARYAERPLRDGKMLIGGEIVSKPLAEYQMPDKENPKKTSKVDPKFLDGKKLSSPGKGKFGLTDEIRRRSLADAITARSEPWFAGAYVNRIWGELMGQSFYSPIDDLGPQKDAVMPEVLARVAGSFRGNGYDMKQLFRDVMNSQAYQRQLRSGESTEAHTLFATHNPVRMNADALWQSLTGTLGPVGGPLALMGTAAPKGPFARLQGLEGQFKQEFAFDPSTKAEEIEGSISQALLLMNNPQINRRMQAKGPTMLARVLSTYKDDEEALRVVYLRTLARNPTEREAARCREHLRSVNNRADAFEDILWALVNSTEYQTRR